VLEGLKETALLGCEQSKPLPLLISSQPSKQLNQLVSDLYNQGQFEEVISTVNTLLVTYPDAFWLLNSQGGARHALKAYDKAIKSYKKALKIRPGYVAASINMGTALKDKGATDALIDHYTKAFAVTHNNLKLHWNLSLILLRCEKFELGWSNYECDGKV
jgi:tetratricopeptide (TPR) repeat protein